MRGHDVRCRVIEGGVLRDHKGMNLPDSHLSTPALTATDRRDARIVAAHRLIAPTVGVCADAAVARRMALCWGVVPVQVEASGTGNWRLLCTQLARRCGLAPRGQRVLVISGFHDDEASSEPVLKVLSR